MLRSGFGHEAAGAASGQRRVLLSIWIQAAQRRVLTPGAAPRLDRPAQGVTIGSFFVAQSSASGATGAPSRLWVNPQGCPATLLCGAHPFPQKEHAGAVKVTAVGGAMLPAGTRATLAEETAVLETSALQLFSYADRRAAPQELCSAVFLPDDELVSTLTRTLVPSAFAWKHMSVCDDTVGVGVCCLVLAWSLRMP